GCDINDKAQHPIHSYRGPRPQSPELENRQRPYLFPKMHSGSTFPVHDQRLNKGLHREVMLKHKDTPQNMNTNTVKSSSRPPRRQSLHQTLLMAPSEGLPAQPTKAIVCQYTLYYPGNMPLIITAGHGGTILPGETF